MAETFFYHSLGSSKKNFGSLRLLLYTTGSRVPTIWGSSGIYKNLKQAIVNKKKEEKREISAIGRNKDGKYIGR